MVSGSLALRDMYCAMRALMSGCGSGASSVTGEAANSASADLRGVLFSSGDALSLAKVAMVAQGRGR